MALRPGIIGVLFMLSFGMLTACGGSDACAVVQVDPDCVEENSSSNGSGLAGELTLVVSPFEADTMLFALVSEDGARVAFEGSRSSDGSIATIDRVVFTQRSVEVTFGPGLRVDEPDQAARTALANDPSKFAVEFISAVDTASGESFAARIFYRPDVINVQAMAPITTDTFIENPTALLPVSDSPELARFMAEAEGTSDPHPDGGGAAGVSGRRSLNRAYSGCGSPEIDAKLGNTRADSLQLSGTFVNGAVTGTLTRAGSSLPFEAHQFE